MGVCRDLDYDVCTTALDTVSGVESDTMKWTDWLRCPDCGSDVEVEGITYHEFWFRCSSDDCDTEMRVGPL